MIKTIIVLIIVGLFTSALTGIFQMIWYNTLVPIGFEPIEFYFAFGLMIGFEFFFSIFLIIVKAVIYKDARKI